MPNYKITLSLDTIGTLDEGGLLEELMHDQLMKIVNESAGQDLDVQVYRAVGEARRLVALSDLLESIHYDRRKAARINKGGE